MTINIKSYSYRGFEIVCVSNAILVHRGSREGPIVFEAQSVDDAKFKIDNELRGPVGHISSYNSVLGA